MSSLPKHISWRQLISFELYFAMKQGVAPILILFAFVYGFLINAQGIGEGMDQLAINAPYRISYFLTLTSVILAFAVALIAVAVILKDKEHQFDQLVSAAIAYSDLLLIKSRSCAILVLSCICSIALVLGMLVAIGLADIAPARLQTLQFSHFVWPWLIIVLPNILIVTAISIFATLKWRTAKVTYISSLVLVMLLGIAMIVINAPITGPTTLAVTHWTQVFALLDPFASSALFEQTQYWTTEDKNNETLDLSGYLLINRLWVLTLAIVLFLAALKTTRRNQSFSAINLWWYQLRHELNLVFLNRPMALFLVLWAIMVVVGISMVAGVVSSHEFSGKYPTSGYLIAHSGEAFQDFAQAVLVFVVSDVLWRERDQNFANLIYATPVTNTCIFITKLCSILVVPLIMAAILIVFCVTYQLAVGYANVDYALYAFSFYYLALPVLLQAVLLFTIQSMVANKTRLNKYIGLLVGASVLILVSQLSSLFGIQHPAFLINQLPDLSRGYSELGKFGGADEYFNHLAVYWVSFAILLIFIALRFGSALQRLSAQTKKPMLWLLPTAGTVLIFIMASLSLNSQLSDTSGFRLANSFEQDFAEYEKHYKKHQSLAVPQFASTSLQIDIFPHQKRVEVAATNQLVNLSDANIEQIFVTSKLPLDTISLTGGELVHQASRTHWHVYLFKLSEPMVSGERLDFKYSLQMRSLPFALNKSLVENGIYFHQGQFEPLLGYAEFMELQSAPVRAQFGLAPHPKLNENLTHKDDLGDGKLVNQKRKMDVILSTDISQVAVTSGEVINQWQEGSRQYKHFSMTNEVYPILGYFSAEYATKTITVKGLRVTIYYHPNHQQNVEEILKATRFTLNHMREHYHDYPFSSLRLVEVPKYHSFGGKASAGVVALNELLFLQDYQDDAAINNVARNTIHEVAHQWFGELVTPKITFGEKIVTESITKELEQTVLGEMYGNSMATSLASFNQRRYLIGRSFATQQEVPLLLAQGEPYLSYGKGPLVMGQVRTLLGDQTYQKVLKEFIDRHKNGMTATLFDLVQLFKQASKEPELIEYWFNKTDSDFTDPQHLKGKQK